MPSNRKKMRREKQKKRGGEKAKRKSQDRCVTFNPCKNYLEILLSVHPRTSQANILHLDQQATKCTTCEQICGTYYLLKARQFNTRTQLNYLQSTLFGKISRSKWVNEGLMAIKKIIFQTNIFQQHYNIISLTGVVSWGPILARIPPSIFSLSWRTLEFSYVKYFGIGISMSSYK